ncbi:MAG: ornithine carbamoyltransferase [Phototrophicaceae bacterium]
MNHLISLSDWSKDDLERLLELAVQLKAEWRTGGNTPVLAGKVLAMVFQKPSLRTRVSFEMAMKHLGGDAMMLGPSEIGLGKRESIGDVARVLSGYVQGIMARVFDHEHVVELARYASVPVINGLSDDRHPCQALADILTIHERFGSLQGLKFAFIGDGNNVAASSLIACAKYGLDFAIASPPGYALDGAVIDEARGLGDIKIETFLEPEDAVRDADVVYTDTWVSMGQEDEVAARLALFEPYQVNTELLKLAKPTAIVLHCLPAHRGQEITDEVADGPQSMIFPQAENRLHAQKAVLVELMK